MMGMCIGIFVVDEIVEGNVYWDCVLWKLDIHATKNWLALKHPDNYVVIHFLILSIISTDVMFFPLYGD